MSIALTALFPDGLVPDREWVLGQSIRFDPAAVRARLPDAAMWPDELDSASAGSGRYRLVSRRDVFEVATRAAQDGSPIAAAQLHVACVVWGTSPGLTMVRALRPLSQPDAADKLAKALAVVRSEGPVSAYRALSGRNRLKITGLAAGFFTKFLYFGGYDANALMGRPLIYDSRVVDSLRRMTTDAWEIDGPADMYGRYLDLAADWAHDFNTTPDVIERALFGR